jgi:hypothetical protein
VYRAFFVASTKRLFRSPQWIEPHYSKYFRYNTKVTFPTCGRSCFFLAKSLYLCQPTQNILPQNGLRPLVGQNLMREANKVIAVIGHWRHYPDTQ